MKNGKKMIAIALAAILITVLAAGCAGGAARDDSNEQSADEGACGIYVRLERDDAATLFLRSGSDTEECDNADGAWQLMGEDLVQISRAENRAVLFTAGACDADGTVLAEASFFYDAAQERLYVTISEDGVTCAASDADDAAQIAPVLTLPILDEIDANVTPGSAGSSLQAVQEAAKLLEWSENTGLDPAEIGDAASTWLASRGDEQALCLEKLALVDEAYQKLLGADARELLDSAGCEDVAITWGSEPSDGVEAIMQAAGQR